MLNKQRFYRRFVFFLGVVVGITVVVIQAQSDTPRPLYALPGANEAVYQSRDMVLSADGRTMVAANSLNDTVSVFDVIAGTVSAEIPVGDDPRTLALTDDESQALTVNRADGTLSVVDLETLEVVNTIDLGVLPYAVVTNDNETAYVSIQSTSEIVKIDLISGDIVDRVSVASDPAGLTIWGDFLYVTHLWSGKLSMIYLPQIELVRTVSINHDTALSQSMTIDTRNGTAYLPASRSFTENQNPTHDSLVFPIVNIVTLGDMQVHNVERVELARAGFPVNMPFDSVFDPVRNYLYVANAGSDDVAVVDLNTGYARSVIPVGANPRSLILSRDRSLLFVHNVIDGTVTTIETRNLTVTDVLPISDLTIPIDTLIGTQLFHTANDSRLTTDHWVSCANCHFDGMSDGRVWLGYGEDGRNTPVLYDLSQSAPYRWMAEWDELSDVERKIREMHGGSGLIDLPTPELDDAPITGLSLDMDTLDAYVSMLSVPEIPSTGSEAGKAIFESLGCARCHVGEAGTDGLQHEVGTGGEIDTPVLVALWQSSPYFHDGRAKTLFDVFMLPGDHQIVGTEDPQAIEDLLAYLRSR